MKYSKYSLMIFFVLLLSCKKQWLDIKSNKADIVPKTFADFQAILDNDGIMNTGYPSLPTVGSDNYYVTYTAWQARPNAQERNAYIWASGIYEGEPGYDWQNCYQIVEYANIVLEGLQKMQPAENSILWNTLKGEALFFRTNAFYSLAQTFAKSYTVSSAATDPGIPLRLSADVNRLSARASVQQTYERMITDLSAADSLLPLTVLYKTRPSKPAAEALLSKIYLQMEDYTDAEKYANAALSKFSSLIDYNTLNPGPGFPFPTFQTGNNEIIFYSTCSSFGILSPSTLRVDSFLYRSYSSNDLRKTILYKDNGINGISFRGNYTGIPLPFFSGIATNELYLIRAEALVRNGKISEGMNDLNSLLAKRWKAGTFIPLGASGTADALQKIITEKRKELPFAGSLRWEELRRLNKDTQYAVTLSRVLNGQQYLLPPNDNRYVYPIPDNEIRLSGISQNPR